MKKRIPKRLIKAHINFYNGAKMIEIKENENVTDNNATNDTLSDIAVKFENLTNEVDDLPKYKNFDKSICKLLRDVDHLISEMNNQHGMSAEHVALMNIRSGILLWIQTRKEYIESFKLKN